MAVKIYLYDTDYDCIGSGCCSLQYVQWQLEVANGEDIEVHISSVGGDAIQAVAIYNLLKTYAGKVTVFIDALAASAACTIAMAGSERIMSKYALLMIHKPSVFSGGTSDDLEGDAKMLDAIEANIVSIISDTTGQTPEKISEMLAATTWLDAETALSLGFVTKVEDYAEPVKNALLIGSFATTAPKKMQIVLNKIVKPAERPQSTNEMTKEEVEAIVAPTNTLLAKIMNWFKPSVKKVTTNKGEKFFVGNIAEGTLVFNDADMDKAAEDEDEVEAENNGKKVTMSIKDGKISNVKNEEDTNDDNEDDDEDLDAENKVVLNTAGIKFGKKIESKVVKNAMASKIAEISNKAKEQDALLIDVTNQLKIANAGLQKREEDIRATIQSEFNPDGSKRSNKAKTENGVPDFLKPKTEMAQNAVKQSVQNKK